MIDKNQLRTSIIRPVLEYLDPLIPYSMAAENLLMGTCAQESRVGSYVKQVNGPACGIFQMEPATEKDILKNFLSYRGDLARNVLFLLPAYRSYDMHGMVGDLYYQVAMARIHYYRVKFALPEDNVEQLANYWKLHYNTPEGKGTIEEFIDNYERYVS